MRPDLLFAILALTEDEPPSEFRIFTAGEVESTKGTVLFDGQAAQAVMAAYRDYGNELMIDYGHASVSPLQVDPALSGRAAGWFKLEVRNGELWAVDVRWTEPAAEALRRKEWRYMSPAFVTKGPSKRVIEVINVALTNIPATKRLEPLMAASAIEPKESPMQIEKLLAALGLPADANEETITKKLAELSASKPAAPATAPQVQASRAAIIGDEAFEQIAREAHHDVRLQNEISSLREQQRVSQVRDILRSTDRHTTPAFESLALGKSPDEVREMLAILPPKPKAISAPAAQRRNVELTGADRRVGRMCGMDLKALADHKLELFEREQTRARLRAEAMMGELEEV